MTLLWALHGQEFSAIPQHDQCQNADNQTPELADAWHEQRDKNCAPPKPALSSSAFSHAHKPHDPDHEEGDQENGDNGACPLRKRHIPAINKVPITLLGTHKGCCPTIKGFFLEFIIESYFS